MKKYILLFILGGSLASLIYQIGLSLTLSILILIIGLILANNWILVQADEDEVPLEDPQEEDD